MQAADQEQQLREMNVFVEAMREHPLVRDASAAFSTTPGGDVELILHVDPIFDELAEPQPMQQSVSGAAAVDLKHTDKWKKLYDFSFSRLNKDTTPQSAGDDDLCLAGWNSSFTGKPIPQEEMAEWVNETVARV